MPDIVLSSKIESIIPNPAWDKVEIKCALRNVSEANIRITNANGAILNEFPLEIDSPIVAFDINDYSVDVYVVTLFCDSVIAESKNFVKQ